MIEKYEELINQAFENNITSKSGINKIKDIVEEVLENLDSGDLRVCEKINNNWVVHQWVKKAILLSFRTNDNFTLSGPYATWYDKVKGK